MCSRYILNSSPQTLNDRFSLRSETSVNNKIEIRPTDLSTVILYSGASLLHWGLMTEWNPRPIINARAETLEHKQTFKPILSNRCIIPANSYFAWQKSKNGKKTKYIINQYDNDLMAFAGLMDFKHKQFVIITCPPIDTISHIHHRMPVILDPDREKHWVRPMTEIPHALSLLKPYSYSELRATAIR